MLFSNIRSILIFVWEITLVLPDLMRLFLASTFDIYHGFYQYDFKYKHYKSYNHHNYQSYLGLHVFTP